MSNFVVRAHEVQKQFVKKGALQPVRVLLGYERKAEDFSAVHDVSLEVRRGEFLGILGRNGSGKSTMLRILGEVYKPNSGRTVVLGSHTGLYELGLASNRSLTGRQYALRLLSICGISGADAKALLPGIEDFCELGEYFDRKICTYSSGMAARLFFSVATARPYDVYLIDEALSVGDEYFQNKCWERIRGYLNNGSSGVLVTHDWSAVIRLCERAMILNEGRVVECGEAIKTVKKYLNFKRPPLGALQFGALPERVDFGANESLNLDIPILGSLAGEFKLAFSIERVEQKSGWVVMLADDGLAFCKGQKAGIVRLNIDKFRLGAGSYLLNIFLMDDKGTILDARGWTYGNEIQLNVLGEVSNSLVHLEWTLGESAYV